MQSLFALWSHIKRFHRAEDGVVTLEFVLVFPVFFMMFLMTYENGMISLRHFALERGVDIAVRDVRIGRMAVPTREILRDRICEVAGIIPNCSTQLEIEMVRRTARAWVPVDTTVKCIDRGAAVQPVVQFTNGGNNDLVVLRVCARFDPFLPTSGIGRAIVQGNNNSAAGGSYALVSTAAFVVEPFGASP